MNNRQARKLTPCTAGWNLLSCLLQEVSSLGSPAPVMVVVVEAWPVLDSGVCVCMCTSVCCTQWCLVNMSSGLFIISLSSHLRDLQGKQAEPGKGEKPQGPKGGLWDGEALEVMGMCRPAKQHTLPISRLSSSLLLELILDSNRRDLVFLKPSSPLLSLTDGSCISQAWSLACAACIISSGHLGQRRQSLPSLELIV